VVEVRVGLVWTGDVFFSSLASFLSYQAVFFGCFVALKRLLGDGSFEVEEYVLVGCVCFVCGEIMVD
jgi:hypothetical protein